MEHMDEKPRKDIYFKVTGNRGEVRLYHGIFDWRGGLMFKFKLFMDEEFANLPIEDLKIDNRSDHALKHAGIFTAGQIVDNWGRLMHIKNLGELSVKKIRAALFAENLKRIWNDDEKMHQFAESLEVS